MSNIPTNTPEGQAVLAALRAREALIVAIDAFREVGFGSHVTSPLCRALDEVRYSIKEVQS